MSEFVEPIATVTFSEVPNEAYLILVEIARDDQLRQVELGRRLRLEKSTFSRLVRNLARRGRVHRHPAGDDGRGVLPEITDAGAKAAAVQAASRHARLSALLARVPDDQRDAVVVALQTLGGGRR